MESRLPEVAFCVSAKRLHQERRGAEVARQVHTLEVIGSIPIAASHIIRGKAARTGSANQEPRLPAGALPMVL